MPGLWEPAGILERNAGACPHTLHLQTPPLMVFVYSCGARTKDRLYFTLCVGPPPLLLLLISPPPVHGLQARVANQQLKRWWRVLDVYTGGAEHGDDAEAGEDARGGRDGGLAEGNCVFWESVDAKHLVGRPRCKSGGRRTWKSRKRV
jgi:hypothetical protein